MAMGSLTGGRSGWTTRASHVFRCRADGSELESVLTGGMDNPVDVAFTASGERLLSATFLEHPSGGLRDGVVHAVYGGVFGKEHGVLDGHPRTGDLLPVRTDGRVVAGIIQEEGSSHVVVQTSATTRETVDRMEIEAIAPGTASLMPAGYEKLLSPQEIADLVAFLERAP